jgi:hypothetical protein
MRLLALAAASLLLASPLSGQEQELTRPHNWKVRFDRAGTSDTSIYYVDMPPGWHITTGPAAILYDPARTAMGEFEIESEIFLFPTQRLREAFGVFFGGQDLEARNQAYVYFLIRGDGQYLVKRRMGNDTETLVPWSHSEAVLPHDGGEGNVKNVLRVRAGSETVDFYVNGEKVTSVPRSEIDCDGVVGLRVNHGLNLHASSLAVTTAR